MKMAQQENIRKWEYISSAKKIKKAHVSIYLDQRIEGSQF
jgi:hypothetical protein